MSISKKIRFEVFKRDGFKCQYCGQTPPSVTLEVDHIQPSSKGGKDDLNNLITSCFDCNRGKSNVELKRIPNSLQENSEIIRERELQYLEYHKLLVRIDRRINKELEQVNQTFKIYFPERELTTTFLRGSVKTFLQSINVFDVCRAMEKACSRFANAGKQRYDNRWVEPSQAAIKYFCGICWSVINGKGKL